MLYACTFCADESSLISDVVEVEHTGISFKSESKITITAHSVGIGGVWNCSALAVGKPEDGCVDTLPVSAPDELIPVNVEHCCGRKSAITYQLLYHLKSWRR